MMSNPGRLRRLVSVAVIVLWSGVAADARAEKIERIRIDFDSVTPVELSAEPYFEDSFVISVMDNHYDFLPGADVMNIDTYGGSATVRLDSFDRLFDFRSVVIASWEPDPGDLPFDERAFITSSNGGFAEIDHRGTMTFSGPQWTDVSWVEFTVLDPNGDTNQDNLQFDNIRVSVREPSSAPRNSFAER